MAINRPINPVDPVPVNIEQNQPNAISSLSIELLSVFIEHLNHAIELLSNYLYWNIFKSFLSRQWFLSCTASAVFLGAAYWYYSEDRSLRHLHPCIRYCDVIAFINAIGILSDCAFKLIRNTNQLVTTLQQDHFKQISSVTDTLKIDLINQKIPQLFDLLVKRYQETEQMLAVKKQKREKADLEAKTFLLCTRRYGSSYYPLLFNKNVLALVPVRDYLDEPAAPASDPAARPTDTARPAAPGPARPGACVVM